MYFIDPTLLVPADSKFQIPLSLDIGLHALPALFLWYGLSRRQPAARLTLVRFRLDFLLFSPRMSKQANPLVMSAFTVLGYVSWMEHTSAVNQRFPYPFLSTSRSRPTLVSSLIGSQMSSPRLNAAPSTSPAFPCSSGSSTSRTACAS